MQRSTRRISGAALAAATMLAISSAYTAPPATAGQNNASERSQTSSAKKGVQNLMAAEDTRGLWGGSYARARRRFVGKRYSASVRQHQRHARKLRNRKAAR